MQESTNVWYADGTLILRAGNTLFSVYSGIMAQRSAVFEDMFSAAQPNPDETHNGKPVVELFDDPEDLVDFLKSIHDHEYLELQVLPDVPRMLYVLRLATKYQVIYLRTITLNRIIEECCSTVHRLPSETPRALTSLKLDDWSLMVTVARQSDAPILLPRALLACCSLLQQSNLVLNDVPETRLSLVDRAMLADASPRLSRALRRGAHRSVCFPGTDDFLACKDVANCRPTLSRHAEAIEKSMIRLFMFNMMPWDSIVGIGCEACLMRGRKCYTKGSKDVWGKLPSYFSLPSWEQLRKQSGL